VWAVSELLYIALYIGYAARLKPHTDLHSVIADGDVEGLQQILRSDVMPDVNVMGPTGQTPLHLAAYCNQARCMQLLLDEQADYTMTTADGLKNTALHIAVSRNSLHAVHTLCRLQRVGAGPSFFNAQNTHGDTPLHIATDKKYLAIASELLSVPDVNLKVKNNKSKTPADCAPSPTFGFDRNSEEMKMMEMLQEAAAGRRPESTVETIEMSFASVSEERDTVGEIPAPKPRHVETQKVLLQQANLTDEAAFFKKFDSPPHHRASVSAEGPSHHPSVEPPTQQRISSFLMTSGRGSLSRHAMQQSTITDMDCDPEKNTNPVSVGLEDFVELKKLGEGTFGKVLLVKQKATGEYFAMKLMDKAKFKAQNITSKAIGEQFILKTTRHPFVVKLHYAFQGNAFWVLVM
jgi:ankyrin repeat protein